MLLPLPTPKDVHKLYQRLLLAQAMKTTQPPNNIDRVDTYDLSVRKTLLNNTKCRVVLLAVKYRHDHRTIGNIKVGIGTR